MSIALPKGKRRQVRDRIHHVLTAPGTPLARVVKTWHLYRGAPGETTQWASSMLPAVQIRVTSEAQDWSAESQHGGALVFHVTIGVKGTDEGDLLDLWEAIEAQVLPGNESLLNSLLEFGVYNITLRQPAVTNGSLAEEKELTLIGNGAIVLKMNLNT